MAARNFVLMTTFPNKELTDDGQNLVEANLLNAVIVQRFKWVRTVASWWLLRKSGNESKAHDKHVFGVHVTKTVLALAEGDGIRLLDCIWWAQ